MCPPVPPPAMMTESGREEGETGRGESLASAPFIFVSSNSLISNSLCLQSHYETYGTYGTYGTCGTYGTYAFPRLPVSLSPCLLVSFSPCLLVSLSPSLLVSFSPSLLLSLSLFLLLNSLFRYVQQDSDRRKCGDQR